MTEQLERQLIGFIAADRIFVATSSMDNKLKRIRPALAKQIRLPDNNYTGDRVYANIAVEDVTEKSRTMREAINEFADLYPRHGAILNGMIEETRDAKETNLYFGVNPGCRLTADDYLGVMVDLGFTETQARNLYEPIIDASRKISRKRNNTERSILI
jgi:hypothetical protein